MTYKEYKDKEQAEFNKLPIFWAFSDRQFMEEMQKRGLTEHDTDKLYSFGNLGGFYLKSDAQLIRDYLNRPNELLELMKEPEFAEEAFLFEMQNHEYHINWEGDYDVCSCFGHCNFEEGKGGLSYLKEMGYETETLVAYQNARSRFYKMVEENGWM